MKKIILGDCFDRLRNIPDESIDLVFLDPPYEKTNLSWDKMFPMSILDELFRILEPSGVIIIFGREPMLSFFRVHGIKYFKYDLVWRKNRKNGYIQARYKPLQETEKIAVFSKGGMSDKSYPRMRYIPFEARPCHVKCKPGKLKPRYFNSQDVGEYTRTKRGFPTDLIECDQEWKVYHETEKPIQLYEYLMLLYTQLGDNVLDPCFGSGNSMIAAKTLNRNFIGIEQDKQHYERLYSLLQEG